MKEGLKNIRMIGKEIKKKHKRRKSIKDVHEINYSENESKISQTFHPKISILLLKYPMMKLVII